MLPQNNFNQSFFGYQNPYSPFPMFNGNGPLALPHLMNLMGNIGAYHAGGMPGLQMYQCQQAFNQQNPIMSQLFPHTMVGMGGLNNGGCFGF